MNQEKILLNIKESVDSLNGRFDGLEQKVDNMQADVKLLKEGQSDILGIVNFVKDNAADKQTQDDISGTVSFIKDKAMSRQDHDRDISSLHHRVTSLEALH